MVVINDDLLWGIQRLREQNAEELGVQAPKEEPSRNHVQVLGYPTGNLGYQCNPEEKLPENLELAYHILEVRKNSHFRKYQGLYLRLSIYKMCAITLEL